MFNYLFIVSKKKIITVCELFFLEYYYIKYDKYLIDRLLLNVQQAVFQIYSEREHV